MFLTLAIIEYVQLNVAKHILENVSDLKCAL